MIKKENLDYIRLAVSHREVVRLVEQASRIIAQKVADLTVFEHTCYRNIGKELAKQEVKSIKAMAIHYIRRAEALHVKRSNYQHYRYFSDLSQKGSEGQVIEYESKDDLANVNSRQLELKETVTLLAKDDRRRKMILTEWVNGNTNDSDISSILADALGGQARSHCRFVQRFRIECRAELTAQAI